MQYHTIVKNTDLDIDLMCYACFNWDNIHYTIIYIENDKMDQIN